MTDVSAFPKGRLIGRSRWIGPFDRNIASAVATNPTRDDGGEAQEAHRKGEDDCPSGIPHLVDDCASQGRPDGCGDTRGCEEDAEHRAHILGAGESLRALLEQQRSNSAASSPRGAK